MKWSGFFRHQYQRLTAIRDTPHAIAGGVAIGMLLGFTPLFGVKTLLAIALAWVFRWSKLAAAISVSLHDVMLPLWPVLYRVEYKIGFWLIHHEFPPAFKVANLKLEHWLRPETFGKLVAPTLLGSLVVGLPVAALCYWLGKSITIQAQRVRQRRREAGSLEAD